MKSLKTVFTHIITVSKYCSYCSIYTSCVFMIVSRNDNTVLLQYLPDIFMGSSLLILSMSSEISTSEDPHSPHVTLWCSDVSTSSGSQAITIRMEKDAWQCSKFAPNKVSPNLICMRYRRGVHLMASQNETREEKKFCKKEKTFTTF